MREPNNKQHIQIKSLIALFYLVGIIGFAIPISQNLFKQLIPLALILNLVILLFYHQPKSAKSYLIMSLVAVLGFIVEVIGVKTGILFGNYTYGNVMGIRLFNVPLLIGANWLFLSYTMAVGLKLRSPFNIIIGAAIITMFDVILEPVAIFTGMWTWENNHIPMQNYIMWFLLSMIFIAILNHKKHAFNNRIALYLFLSQTLFFIGLNIISFF